MPGTAPEPFPRFMFCSGLMSATGARSHGKSAESGLHFPDQVVRTMFDSEGGTNVTQFEQPECVWQLWLKSIP